MEPQFSCLQAQWLEENNPLLNCSLVVVPVFQSLSLIQPCDSMDCSLPGSSVHKFLQARILEWVAMPSSRGSSRPGDQTCVSYISCISRQELQPLTYKMGVTTVVALLGSHMVSQTWNDCKGTLMFKYSRSCHYFFLCSSLCLHSTSEAELGGKMCKVEDQSPRAVQDQRAY